MNILFKLTKYYLMAVLFIMFLLFLVDVKINPFSRFRDFTGPLEENHRLSEVDLLFQGRLIGPESIVFQEGFLYTGLADGRIVKIKDGKISTVARTGTECVMPYEERKCGRPMGLRLGKDGLLYFCDGFYGVFTMNFTTGELNNIINNSISIGGQQLKFPDDLDLDDEGNIYFSDATTKWDCATLYYMSFEKEYGGRVIRYNILSKETEVMADYLSFPNGIQLSNDGKSLLVAETLNRRILRLYIKGKNKGKLEIFAKALPAEPDNIRRSSSGGYWVGFTVARNSSNPSPLDYLSEYYNLKRFSARMYNLFSSLLVRLSEIIDNHTIRVLAYKLYKLDSIISLLPRHGIVIEFDENGQILRSFHSPEGKIAYISEVVEHDGYLYFGSFMNPYLGRLRL